MNTRSTLPLPLNQIAFSVIDLETTARWWREGLGFLPAGGSRLLMRGPPFAMLKMPSRARFSKRLICASREVPTTR